MAEKSEAQKRSEDEVRKIMEQRGYNTKSYKKQQKKKHRDFSLLPKIFIAVALVAGVACAVVFFVINPSSKDTKKPENTYDLEGSISNRKHEELAAFRECLDVAGKDHPDYEDPQFYDKLIAEYNGKIACYNSYPDVSNSTEKEILEQGLAVAIENKEKAHNYTSSSSTYTPSTYTPPATTETKKDCSYEYNTLVSLDQQATQAHNEIAAYDKIYESELHNKCDSSPDPQACAISLHTEYSARIGRAQTLLDQARAAKQAYDACLNQ